MIPGKLYCAIVSIPIFGNIRFTKVPFNDGTHYYLFNYLKSIDSDTIFMVIENIEYFSKILDTDGNIRYIRSNDDNLFDKVTE